eukprot:scaffold20629_cov32-Tisochrysis_lutea.AAC.1
MLSRACACVISCRSSYCTPWPPSGRLRAVPFSLNTLSLLHTCQSLAFPPKCSMSIALASPAQLSKAVGAVRTVMVDVADWPSRDLRIRLWIGIDILREL